MLTKAPHLFDDATRVTAGDSRGRTSEDYWAFVGPFGGATAATILRALIDHPQRSGDPLSVTVNFCAPIAQGGFDLDVRLVKANKSTQHWSVELTQGGTEVATLATAVFAERRPSWSHQQAEFPQAPPFEQIPSYPKVAASWVKQYDSALSGAIRSSPVWPRERRQTRSPNYGSAIAFPERSICCR
jgi:acyl-CoA thioesterase